MRSPLLLAAALLAGCADGGPLDELGRPDAGVTRLVLVEDRYALNGTEDGLLADFGPHCPQVAYGGGTVRLTGFWRGDEVPPAMLVREFRHPPPDAEGPRPAAVGHGPDLKGLDEATGTILLASPFDGARPLANVTFDEEGVRVDGERLDEGQPWTRTFTYRVEPRGAGPTGPPGQNEREGVAVDETITVRWLGATPVEVAPEAGLCD